MSSEFGKILRVGVFGQSHGRAVGVTMQGLPAGEVIDIAVLEAFLERRRPGKNALSTARVELDRPVFLSGINEGKTCGSPPIPRWRAAWNFPRGASGSPAPAAFSAAS